MTAAKSLRMRISCRSSIANCRLALRLEILNALAPDPTDCVKRPKVSKGERRLPRPAAWDWLNASFGHSVGVNARQLPDALQQQELLGRDAAKAIEREGK